MVCIGVYERFELNLGNGEWGVVRTGVVVLASNRHTALLSIPLTRMH